MLSIYKASAGSGKTYTLAYEYIRTLLGVKNTANNTFRLNHKDFSPNGTTLSNRHKSILAITFTNKATEEMKTRIIDKLNELAKMPEPGNRDADYAQQLINEFGCTRSQLAETAQSALKQLLYSYSDFNISTIDAFFQRVLRTFARELDRQGDFSVEIDSGTAVRQAVNTLLDDFNNGTLASSGFDKWVLEYITKKIEDGERTNILNRDSTLYKEIVSVISNISAENFLPFSADMRKYLEVDSGKAVAAEPAKVINLTRQLLQLKKARSQAIIEQTKRLIEQTKNAGLWDKLNNNIKTRLEEKLLSCNLTQPSPKIIKIINGEESPFNKGTNASQEIIDAYGSLLKLENDTFTLFNDIKIIFKSLTQLTMLGYSWRYLDNFVAENNTVILSDTNHLLLRIIGADETPFIYERMGVQLKNFLIDEFQDTSKMQWANLKPLVSQSMAGNHDNLIIGDEKQSIYRFRNSDSSLLHHQVPNVDFPAPRYNTVVRGGAPGENTNYRSADYIVRFNNTLFSILAKIYGVEGYENVVQEVKHKNVAGYVSFFTIDPKSASSEKEKLDAKYQQMVQQIIRQHYEGNYSWSDIAILVDKNEIGNEIINYILNNYPDIPLISDESLYLKKATSVQTIIGVLRMFAFTVKPTKLDSNSKNRYPSNAEIAIMASRYKIERAKGTDQIAAIEKAVNFDDAADNDSLEKAIYQVRAAKPSSLSSLVECIINNFVTEQERSSQMAYIAAFQDFVLDYTSTYPASVSAFLQYWDVKSEKLSLTPSSGVDAIRVMTVHKSKGLQFQCVHIPNASWQEANIKQKFWTPFPKLEGIDEAVYPPAIFVKFDGKVDDTSVFYDAYNQKINECYVDNLNKAYVAYTRAECELCVYYNPNENMGKTLTKAFAEGTAAADSDTTICFDHIYDPDTDTFTLGEPTTKIASDTPQAAADPSARKLLHYEAYVDDNTQVLTSVEEALEYDDDVMLDNEKPDDDELVFDELSRLRGINLHEMLSLINTSADINRAIEIVATSRQLDSAAIAEATADIHRMLDTDNQLVKRWFGECTKVLTEQTIYLPGSGSNKRLDRAVYYDDGSVDIIDYKFTTDVRPRHKRQLEEYTALLQSMGTKHVRAYLWYPLIDGTPIIEVK